MKIDEDNEMSFLVQYMDTTNLKELAKVSKNQEKKRKRDADKNNPSEK